MGTITGTAVINKVQAILFDTDGVKWSRQELLGWLNDAQREIAVITPWASNVEVAIQMAAGTKQAIPADGWTLIDCHRNVNADGVTPGKAVRLVERKLLDQFNPNWHTATPVTAVQNFITDAFDKLGFWVNPPSDGTGFLWISYSKSPPDLVTEASTISLGDIFEPPIVNYIIYRTCLKNSPYSLGVDKAAAYYTAFTDGLNAKTAGEKLIDPNLALANTPPGPVV